MSPSQRTSTLTGILETNLYIFVETNVRKLQLLIPKDRRPVSAEVNVTAAVRFLGGGNDSRLCPQSRYDISSDESSGTK